MVYSTEADKIFLLDSSHSSLQLLRISKPSFQMSDTQTAAVVTTIVITGEKLATIIAEQPLVIGVLIAAFATIFIYGIRKANLKRNRP
jgi:hypothetical protein